MNSLFNTQDNQEFLGIRSDASLNKANKKGTPQYEEWLRKYREKRGAKAKPEDAAKEKPSVKNILESPLSNWAKKVPLDSYESLDDLVSVLQRNLKDSNIDVYKTKYGLKVITDIGDEQGLKALGQVQSTLKERLKKELGASVISHENPDFGIGFSAEFDELKPTTDKVNVETSYKNSKESIESAIPEDFNISTVENKFKTPLYKDAFNLIKGSYDRHKKMSRSILKKNPTRKQFIDQLDIAVNALKKYGPVNTWADSSDELYHNLWMNEIDLHNKAPKYSEKLKDIDKQVNDSLKDDIYKAVKVALKDPSRKGEVNLDGKKYLFEIPKRKEVINWAGGKKDFVYRIPFTNGKSTTTITLYNDGLREDPWIGNKRKRAEKLGLDASEYDKFEEAKDKHSKKEAANSREFDVRMMMYNTMIGKITDTKY